MEHADIIWKLGHTARTAEAIGVAKGTVDAWRQRNSVPARYWLKLIEYAAKNDIADVTEDAFLRGIEKK